MSKIFISYRREDSKHPPLIEPGLWDELQTLLASHPGGRRRGRRNATHASPLAGKLVDETGERLTPSHSASGGGRRRYYVSKSLIEGDSRDAANGWRLPAAHLEELVATVTKEHLEAAGAAIRMAGATNIRTIADLDARLKALAQGLDVKSSADLVRRVTISQGRIGLDKLALAHVLELAPDAIAGSYLSCTSAFQMRRRGVEMRLLLGDEPTMTDPALLRFVARAHAWWRDVLGGLSIGDLAQRDGVSKRLIGLHLPAASWRPTSWSRLSLVGSLLP